MDDAAGALFESAAAARRRAAFERTAEKPSKKRTLVGGTLKEVLAREAMLAATPPMPTAAHRPPAPTTIGLGDDVPIASAPAAAPSDPVLDMPRHQSARPRPFDGRALDASVQVSTTTPGVGAELVEAPTEPPPEEDNSAFGPAGATEIGLGPDDPDRGMRSERPTPIPGRVEPAAGFEPPSNAAPAAGFEPPPNIAPAPGFEPPPNIEPAAGFEPPPNVEPAAGFGPPPDVEPAAGFGPPPGQDPAAAWASPQPGLGAGGPPQTGSTDAGLGPPAGEPAPTPGFGAAPPGGQAPGPYGQQPYGQQPYGQQPYGQRPQAQMQHYGDDASMLAPPRSNARTIAIVIAVSIAFGVAAAIAVWAII